MSELSEDNLKRLLDRLAEIEARLPQRKLSPLAADLSKFAVDLAKDTKGFVGKRLEPVNTRLADLEFRVTQLEATTTVKVARLPKLETF